MMSVPNSVSRFLTAAIRRVRRIYLIRGAAAVGIVWFFAVVAAMTADARLVIFDDRIRWAMTGGIALAVLVAAMLAVVLPLCRHLDFRKMAKVLDGRHPEFEERFSTLVELSETDSAKAGFSISLFALICRLADDDVRRIDLAKEFPVFGALRRLGFFLLLLLSLVVGIGVSPNLVGRLFVRAVAPWVDVGNLYANDVVVKPGDLVALAGTVIRIEATADESLHAVPTIRLSRRLGEGWTEETTETMSNGVYETTADLAEREWRYRVNAGPAVTRYYRVRVSELPKYESFIARVEYPSYTGFAPQVYSNDEVAAIRAIEGSRVKFDLRVTEPGTVSDFRIDEQPVFEHTMVSNLTSEWSLELVNRDGFRSSKGRHPLTSYRDQAPTLVIESPKAQLPRLPPHAKIHVELTASDDVAVSRPDIRYSIDGAEMRFLKEVDAFASSGGNLWRGSSDIDLSRLDLYNAHNVRFDILAHDFCPEEYGGPHLVTSTVINVDLEYHEWGFEVADLQEQAKGANALVDDAKKRLRDAENLVRQLKDELARDGKVSEDAERRNERAAHEAAEAEKRLEELKDRFASDERFAPLAKPLEKVVSEELKPALERVENSPFRERDERAAEMAKAAEELKKAQERMDELAKRLRERTEKLDVFEKTKDLAARQESLAHSAEQLLKERPVDTAKLEAWKRLEEEARRRTEEIARLNPDADISEARRKMETAARKVDELKRELAEAERKEAEEKRANENAAAREKSAAATRDRALQEAGEAQQRAEAAQEKGDARATGEAQQQAERKIAEAQATPAVKEMQTLASQTQKAADEAKKAADGAQKAADVAKKSEQASEIAKAAERLADVAKEMQKSASAALEEEKTVRAEIRDGLKSEKDLAALDARLRQEIPAAAAERVKALADMQEALKKALAAAEQTPEGRQKADAVKKEAAASQQKAAEQKAVEQKAAALARAEEAQRKAGDSLHAAAERRAAEQNLRRGDRKQAAAEMAKMAEGLERQAATAQKTAADELKKGEATEGTRAMQELAEKAAAEAKKSPRAKAKAARAQIAQQAAVEALKEERAVREGMKSGEKTAADLDALDRTFRQLAKDKTDEMVKEDAARAQEERASAEFARRQAHELSQAASDQQRAQQALSQAKARRTEERNLRNAKNAPAADQKAREADRLEAQAFDAQQSAEDHLERAAATDAVKAMQREASALAELARETPQTVEKTIAAEEAQKAAAEALKRERKIREAIEKGDKIDEDLSAFEEELNAGLRQKAAARIAARQQMSEKAIREAREAIGTEETAKVAELADRALQAVRDEVAARRAEAELLGNEAQNENLREAENALDAVRSRDNEERTREDRISSLQQAASEAFERGDRDRALGLQREIAKAQARAAESASDNEEEAEAREEANEAQETAQEAGEKTRRSWNNETKAEAAKAQRTAMESEKAAHEASQLSRAMDMIAAAEKESARANAVPEESAGEQGEERGEERGAKGGEMQGASARKDTAEAAKDASDALNREVRSQAAALGLNPQKQAGAGQGREKGQNDESSGGGGIGDEVNKLASELKRGEEPDFFKKLFTRLGWFKIHGVSKDGLRERDLSEVPREYRDLVRRYFLKLAEENPENSD